MLWNLPNSGKRSSVENIGKKPREKNQKQTNKQNNEHRLARTWNGIDGMTGRQHWATPQLTTGKVTCMSPGNLRHRHFTEKYFLKVVVCFRSDSFRLRGGFQCFDCLLLILFRRSVDVPWEISPQRCEKVYAEFPLHFPSLLPVKVWNCCSSVSQARDNLDMQNRMQTFKFISQ